MSDLKTDILDAVRRSVVKQNPWQPYTGEAGGQGWINAITGEIRYQDSRPAPQEGTPDDAEVEGYPAEEHPDELGEPDPTEMLADNLDEGMEVDLELEGIASDDDVKVVEDAEIVDMVPHDSFGPRVAYEDPESGHQEEHQVAWDEIDASPFELEPTDGWAEGWTETPENLARLEHDQAVEVYDPENQRYLQGEVQMIDEDFTGQDDTYVSVVTEDNQTIEWVDGDPQHHDALLTAAEDVFPPVEPPDGQPWDYVDSLALDEGNEVAFWNGDEHEVQEGVINELSINTVGNIAGMAVQLEDGGVLPINDANGSFLMEPEDAKLAQLADAPTVDDPAIEPDVAADLGIHEGALAAVDFPEGTGVGEVSVEDHGEKGRWAYIGDDDLGIPLDDPGHPLAQLQVGEVEDTWAEGEEAPAAKPGDQILVGDEPKTVAMEEDGLITAESGEQFDVGEADRVKPTELTEDFSPGPGWDVDLPSQFKVEDHVQFYDPESDEVIADEVTDAVDYGTGVVPTEEHGDVSVKQIRAYADTGKLAPNQAEPDYVESGDVVTIQGGDGSTFEGYVIEGVHGLGEPQIQILDSDGETRSVTLDERNYGLTDHDEFGMATDVVDTDYGDIDPAQAAEQISHSVNLGHSHVERDRLLAELYQHVPPEGVEDVRHALVNGGSSCWKNDSSSELAGEWEEALKIAAEIDAPTRGGHTPTAEMVEAAEAIHELSKKRWRKYTPDEVYRGLSDEGGGGLFANFLQDPEADEYEVPLLAANNFSEQEHTAKSLGSSPLLVRRDGHEIDSDQVAAYHDDFFVGPNDSEAEISIQGEDFTVPSDQFYVGNQDNHFGDSPHKWDQQTAQAFKEKAQNYGADVFSEYNPEDEATDEQLRNAVKIERVLRENHDINTTGMDMFEHARDRLQVDSPEEIAHPELGSGTAANQHFDHPSQIPVETEVTYREHGEANPGLVTGFEGDQIEVENYDTGAARLIDPSSLQSIDWAPEPYGEPADVDTDSLTGENFDQLDDVLVWSGGDWEEATVMEVMDGANGDELKVSMPNGSSNYFETDSGRVVPEDLDTSASEGVGSVGDLEPGDMVNMEYTTTDYDDSVEVIDVDPDSGEIEVLPNSDQNESQWAPFSAVESVPSEGSDGFSPYAHENYGQQGEMPADDTEVLADTPGGEVEGHVQYTSGDDDWVYVEDSAGNVHTVAPQNVYPGSPEAAGVSEGSDAPDALAGIEEGMEIDHPEWMGEVMVDEISDDSITVIDSNGFDYENDFDEGIVSEYDWSDHVASEGSDGEAEEWDPDVGTAVDVPDWDEGDYEVTEIYETPSGKEGYWIGNEDDPKIDLLETDEIEPAEGSDEDDWSSVGPENLHDAAPGTFEEITLTDVPGHGEVDVDVLDVPSDDGGPYEVGTSDPGTDERWLVWPDGQVEPV